MDTVCSAPCGLFHYRNFLKFSTNSLLMRPLKHLRANVTNGQTFGGNSSEINSAHILMLGRP